MGRMYAVLLCVCLVLATLIEPSTALLGRQGLINRRPATALQAQDTPRQSFLPNSNPFTRVEATEIPLSRDVSELPESFGDAVKRASRSTIECINTGTKTCRIDFDTSIADMTYTSLKNTMPFIKEFVKVISVDMGLISAAAPAAAAAPAEGQGEGQSDVQSTQANSVTGTIRLFFPDMGAAALVRRDWKMGTEASEVPASLQTANVQNDPLMPTDRVAIILCPLYSETDFVKRVVELCATESIPCILVNPELINMDQGLGVRARNLRNNLLAQFVPTYKLRTMKQGALVREWPRGYAVWNEDSSQADGYSLLQCYGREPTREMVMDLYDAANPEDPNAKSKEPSAASAVFNEISGFFKGLSRL